MSATHTALYYHVVFGTYKRSAWLTPELHERLQPYVGGIVRKLGGVLLAAGGIEDHVHLLPSLPPTIPLSVAVGKIKTATSHWLKAEHGLGNFRWQRGYAALTLASRQIEPITGYINSQQERHHKLSVQAELRAFILACGVDPSSLHPNDALAWCL